MPSSEKPIMESKFKRAIVALPILAILPLMIRVFLMAEPIAPILENIFGTSRFQWGGPVAVPVAKEFYHVGFVDNLFSRITLAFAQLQFGHDAKAYWQSLVFLTDFAGMYAVMLVESCRRVDTFALFRYPFFLLFVAQLGGIGNFGAIYFYLLYVLTPTFKLLSPDFVRPDVRYCAAVIPTLVLAYYSSHYPSYFHPSLEARNWWNWIWQLFPVWGSVTFLILSRKSVSKVFRAGSTDSLTSIRAIVGAAAVANTVTYWYTLWHMEDSVKEVFVPQYLVESPQEADVALRTIIQYDYICTFAAGFLWLAYSFVDLQRAGVCYISWIKFIPAAFLVGSAVGPGTLFLLVWLSREEIMTKRV